MRTMKHQYKYQRRSQLIDVPENRVLLEGAWWFYGMFLFLAYFLGSG